MHDDDDDIAPIEWRELLIGVVLGCVVWAMIGGTVAMLLQ